MSQALSVLWQRVRSIDGELSSHLSDLMIVLGYISVGIYAGGYQYVTSYNEFFALPVKTDPASLSTFVVFIESVVLGGSAVTTFICFLVLVTTILVNFVARNVFQVWFSYLLISTLAFIVVTICIAMGGYWGQQHAEADISLKSSLPSIELKILSKQDCNNVAAPTDASRLLFSDELFVYFFTPVDAANSEVIIESISTSCISGVTLQRKVVRP